MSIRPQCSAVSDTKSFEYSLSGRRDAGFLIFGQLYQFAKCYRALLPKQALPVLDWLALLELRGQPLTQLSSRDFLFRLKLQTDLDGACRVKARRDQSDDKAPDSAIESQAEVVKEKFTVKARVFVYLLETLLKDVRLNADIVRGMANFDPTVLLALPKEQSVSMLPIRCSPYCTTVSMFADGCPIRLWLKLGMST